MNEYFDNPLDLRYLRRYNDASGILLYTAKIDVGRLLGERESFSCLYEGRRYEFGGIDIVGFKRYGEIYTYYIEFREVRYDFVEDDDDEMDDGSEATRERALPREDGSDSVPAGRARL